MYTISPNDFLTVGIIFLISAVVISIILIFVVAYRGKK